MHAQAKETMNTSSENINRWRNILAGKEVYGAGSIIEQAADFYYENILPLVLTEVKNRVTSSQNAPGDVGTLVSLMGYSPETTVIACTVLEPDFLHVVRSSPSPDYIPSITNLLNRISGAYKPKMGVYEVMCDATDPYEIYKAVSLSLKRTIPHDLKNKRNIVDITGGKKVMSAMASLAASHQKALIAYIDGEYDPALRRPQPLTEHLTLINPLALNKSGTT